MQPGRVAAPDSVTGLANGERVRGFDLARGLAVLFMIAVHVLWHWGAPDTWVSPIGTFISILGGPTGAPVFMFLMGASLAFSSRQGFSSLAARGAWLVFLGYLLNLLRGTIPAIFGMSAGLVTQQQIEPFTPWFLFTTVDIHQMAGLSLIAIAALRLAFRPGWPWLVLAAGLALIAPVVRGLSFGTPLLDGPLTPVIGGADNVYYAVVPWLVFPLAGAVFGRILVAAPDRTRIFRLGALLGLGLAAIGGILVVIQQPTFDVVTYWHEPLSFIIGIVGLVLLWLWACDAVARRAWLDRRLGILYRWSAMVIPFYFTHWIVVGWGIAIVGFRDLPLWPVLATIPIAVIVTDRLSKYAAVIETPPWARRRPSIAVPVPGTLAPEALPTDGA
jgi:uncharacterized membrane protein